MRKIGYFFILTVLLCSIPSAKGQTIITTEIICSDDAEANEFFPDTNYGSEETISVGRESNNFSAIYIAFDISEMPNTFIKLELAVNLWYTTAPDQDYDMQLMKLDTDWNEPWNETSITWNDKPGYVSFITSFKVNTTNPSKTYSFDVTNYTRNNHNYFPVAFEAIDEGECNCLSKEYTPTNSSDAPRLIMYYLEDLSEIPFGNFYMIGLFIAFGITIQIIRLKKKPM